MVTKKATTEATTQVVEIPKINIKTVTFRVRGTAPLIVSRFSEKAKQMILDKQMKKADKGREAKDPAAQFRSSLYEFADGKRTGFPAVGFKASMVRAGKQLGLTMTDLRGRFHVLAEEGDLIQIHGSLRMRDDMVRLAGMGAPADVRFRGEYAPGWEANVSIQYFANAISVEQLAQLLTLAGFSCGLGEWRPEKSNSGSFGRFELVTE